MLNVSFRRRKINSPKIIKELQDVAQQRTILYYYFWNGDAKTTSPLLMAVSIMAQLIYHARTLDETIQIELLNTLKTVISEGTAYSDWGRNINSVWQAFGIMLQKYPQAVTIIIDALDECTDPS